MLGRHHLTVMGKEASHRPAPPAHDPGQANAAGRSPPGSHRADALAASSWGRIEVVGEAAEIGIQQQGTVVKAAIMVLPVGRTRHLAIPVRVATSRSLRPRRKRSTPSRFLSASSTMAVEMLCQPGLPAMKVKQLLQVVNTAPPLLLREPGSPVPSMAGVASFQGSGPGLSPPYCRCATGTAPLGDPSGERCTSTARLEQGIVGVGEQAQGRHDRPSRKTGNG